MSIEVELGTAAPLIPTIVTPTSDQLTKVADAAIARQIVATDAARKGNPLIVYGVFGAACLGYYFMNRKQRRF